MTNSFCASRSVLQKLLALTSYFIVYGIFPQNPSQLSPEQADICSSKIHDLCLGSLLQHAQQDSKLQNIVISAAKAIMNLDTTKQVLLVWEWDAQ